jgi:hypothetical protein
VLKTYWLRPISVGLRASAGESRDMATRLSRTVEANNAKLLIREEGAKECQSGAGRRRARQEPWNISIFFHV